MLVSGVDVFNGSRGPDILLSGIESALDLNDADVDACGILLTLLSGFLIKGPTNRLYLLEPELLIFPFGSLFTL